MGREGANVPRPVQRAAEQGREAGQGQKEEAGRGHRGNLRPHAPGGAGHRVQAAGRAEQTGQCAGARVLDRQDQLAPGVHGETRAEPVISYRLVI